MSFCGGGGGTKFSGWSNGGTIFSGSKGGANYFLDQRGGTCIFHTMVMYIIVEPIQSL